MPHKLWINVYRWLSLRPAPPVDSCPIAGPDVVPCCSFSFAPSSEVAGAAVFELPFPSACVLADPVSAGPPDVFVDPTEPLRVAPDDAAPPPALVAPLTLVPC